MLKPQSARAHLHRISVLLLIAVAAVLCSVPLANQALAQEGSVAIPERDPDNPWLIHDTARLFSTDQLKRFQFDLRRLQGLGVEMLVYTRRADAAREDAEEFAEALRTAWNVESAPGADDGLVMLITVNDEFPRRSTFILSPGQNFFPVGQMDADDLNHVYEQEIEPNFRENRYDVALAYAVRRVLYAADYTPPDPPALTGVHAFAHEAAKIGGPILLQAALLGLAIVPALTERRLTIRPKRKTVHAYAAVFGAASGLLALFAIVGRSELGVLMAILVLALVIAVMAFFRKRNVEASSVSQRVRVPSFGRNPRRALVRMHQRNDRYAHYT
jgi:uncharacterized membrane protein YgcG